MVTLCSMAGVVVSMMGVALTGHADLCSHTQAISLIVTHRNDDMSAASPSSFRAASKTAASKAAPARPKLRAIPEAQARLLCAGVVPAQLFMPQLQSHL